MTDVLATPVNSNPEAMMHSARSSGILFVLLASAAFCVMPSRAVAQAAPDSSKATEPPPTSSGASTATPIANQTASSVTLPPKGQYKHGFKIRTDYDKFEDRTVTVLDKVWDDTDGFTNQSHYKLTPSFSYSGSGQTPSLDAIKITLQLNADVEIGKEAISGAVEQQSKFADPDQRKLVFLVDGSLSRECGGRKVFGRRRRVGRSVTNDSIGQTRN